MILLCPYNSKTLPVQLSLIIFYERKCRMVILTEAHPAPDHYIISVCHPHKLVDKHSAIPQLNPVERAYVL